MHHRPWPIRSELARQLAKHCELLAIDSDEVASKKSPITFNGLIIDARDYSSLASVITEEFDEAIVSLGGSLEEVFCALFT